ncbi:MAG: response regulator [Reinekea sp.]|jgi:twitching motility two-component system response regulator PilH
MSHKVLVVDDNPADLKNLERIVTAQKMHSISATSGSEALEKARSELPDIILMDIIMDGMDGFNTCRELSKDATLSKIPVVFVSGKNQKADQMWAAKQGAKALISKPYDDATIIEQLQIWAS